MTESVRSRMSTSMVQGAINKARYTVTVEPVLMIFMLGNNLQYVAIQQLLLLKTCMIEYNNTDVCDHLSDYPDKEDKIQGLASYWLIILNAGLTVSSVLSTLFLGAWSDRVGRRATLIIPCIGSLINAVILIFSSLNIFMPVWYVVLGTVFLGLTGGFTLLISCVFSYMGDCTTSENRTSRFAILESMITIGSFVGLLTIGPVIDNLGFVAAFAYYIGCNVVPIIYIILWLPESLPNIAKPAANGISEYDDNKELVDDLDGRVENELGRVGNRRTHFCAEFLRVENFKGAVRTVTRKRPYHQRAQLWLMIACMTVFQFVSSGEGDTTVLYLKKNPLKFTATQISYYLGLKNCVVGVTLLAAIPVIRKLISVRDTTLASVAILFRSSAYILLAFARNIIMVFCVPFLMAPAAVPGAVVRSMLSKIVSPSEQGSLFSVVACMESLMVFISSATFNALYPATIHVMEGGFVFIVMAAVLFCPFIIMFWIRDLQNLEASYQIQREEESSENYTAAEGEHSGDPGPIISYRSMEKTEDSSI